MVEVGEGLGRGEKLSSWIVEREVGELHPARRESSPRILRQYEKGAQCGCWQLFVVGCAEGCLLNVDFVSKFLSLLSI
jgi:hypothetical protein